MGFSQSCFVIESLRGRKKQTNTSLVYGVLENKDPSVLISWMMLLSHPVSLPLKFLNSCCLRLFKCQHLGTSALPRGWVQCKQGSVRRWQKTGMDGILRGPLAQFLPHGCSACSYSPCFSPVPYNSPQCFCSLTPSKADLILIPELPWCDLSQLFVPSVEDQVLLTSNFFSFLFFFYLLGHAF